MEAINEFKKVIEHHDKAITDLNSRMGGVERTLQNMDHKLDRFISAQNTAQVNRPTAILDAIRTGLSILQALAFLTGATVAAIVYVSSNANNSDLAVLKYQISELKSAARHDHEGRFAWAPGLPPRSSMAPQ